MLRTEDHSFTPTEGGREPDADTTRRDDACRPLVNNRYGIKQAAMVAIGATALGFAAMPGRANAEYPEFDFGSCTEKTHLVGPGGHQMRVRYDPLTDEECFLSGDSAYTATMLCSQSEAAPVEVSTFSGDYVAYFDMNGNNMILGNQSHRTNYIYNRSDSASDWTYASSSPYGDRASYNEADAGGEVVSVEYTDSYDLYDIYSSTDGLQIPEAAEYGVSEGSPDAYSDGLWFNIGSDLYGLDRSTGNPADFLLANALYPTYDSTNQELNFAWDPDGDLHYTLYSCPQIPTPTDSDSDGYSSTEDCDDTNASVHPGATETPYNGVDDDCDPLTPDDDIDADGYGITTDCDDTNASINPAATEVCDTVDNDCDINVDEGVMTTYYDDSDSDGYGSSSATVEEGCSVPTRHSANNADCDDTLRAVNPGATETTYNGADDDCNSFTLDDDLDIDGYGIADDCDDTNASINPGATEIPDNGVDENCNPSDDVTATDPDNDGDGYTVAEGDCDDSNPAVNPGAPEVTGDGLDNDCNPATLDTTETDPNNTDDDSDGYTENEGDCDDTDPTINPSADEYPDGIDSNCNDIPDNEDSNIITYVANTGCEDSMLEAISIGGRKIVYIEPSDSASTYSMDSDSCVFSLVGAPGTDGTGLYEEVTLEENGMTMIWDGGSNPDLSESYYVLIPDSDTSYSANTHQAETPSIYGADRLWAAIAGTEWSSQNYIDSTNGDFVTDIQLADPQLVLGNYTGDDSEFADPNLFEPQSTLDVAGESAQFRQSEDGYTSISVTDAEGHTELVFEEGGNTDTGNETGETGDTAPIDTGSVQRPPEETCGCSATSPEGTPIGQALNKFGAAMLLLLGIRKRRQ